MPEVAAPFEAVLADLPPFPSVAVRLGSLLAKENPSIDEAVGLIESDPALSTDLLRRANSAAYGFVSEITSLQHCLVVIGFAEVRRLALAMSARRFAKDALGRPELERCWRNSLAVAILAEKVAVEIGVSQEAAYAAGLMQDIGCLSLFTARPDEYAEILHQATADGPIDDTDYFLRREADVFGFDHAAAGRWLAEQWGLPTELVEAAGRHHDRTQPDEAGLLAAVQTAVRAADSLGFGLTESVQGPDWESVVAPLPSPAAEALRNWNQDGVIEEITRRTGRLNAEPQEQTERPKQTQQAEQAEQPQEPPTPPVTSDPVENPGLAWEVVAAAVLVAATLGGAAAVLLLR